MAVQATPGKNISDSITIDASELDFMSPEQGELTIASSADPEQEYIQSQGWGSIQRIRALPPWIDELERDFGLDIYDRMMDEPTVNSSVGILTSAALGHEMELSPSRDDDHPEYEDAVKMRDFVEENICRLEDTDFIPYLYEMSSGAFAHGFQCSEVVYELEDSKSVPNGGPKYMWDKLKPKAQTQTSFVVDPYDNVVGYLHGRNNFAAPWQLPLPDGQGNIPNFLPREKVPTFTYMMNRSDPRGRSGLRPAYHAWWMLQEAYDNARKFMRLFGVPPIWSTLPPNAVDQIKDSETGEVLAKPKNAAQTQNDRLKAIRSGGIITLGYQAVVNTLEPTSDGAFILNLITRQEARIIKAITFQELATNAAPGATRATSSIHQDMFGIRVALLRFRTIAFVLNKLIIPLIDLNFGEEYRSLAPKISFGSVELNDLPSVGIMIARLLAAGAIKKDQLPEIYEMLNLPPSELLKMEIQVAFDQMNQGMLLDAQGQPMVNLPPGMGAPQQQAPIPQPTNGPGQGNSKRTGSTDRSGAEPGVGMREDMKRQYGMPGYTR